MKASTLSVYIRIAFALALIGCGGDNQTPTKDMRPPDGGSDSGKGVEFDAFTRDANLSDAEFDVMLEPDGPFDTIRHTWISVNRISEEMLGRIPAIVEGRERQFQWVLPPSGWTVDVNVRHPGGWEPPNEPPYVLLRSVSGGADPVILSETGAEVLEGGWARTDFGHRWSARVTDAWSGEGTYLLQYAIDGMVGDELPISMLEQTPERDPFVEIDHWGVSFSRDRSELKVAIKSGEAVVSSTNRSNQVPDFEEALAAIGLLGDTPTWRTRFLDLYKKRLRDLVVSYYPEVRIELHFEGDAEVPDPTMWTELGWSQLAVGGEDPNYVPGGRTFFGRAEVDWNNQEANDNTGPQLGVFTTNFVRFILGNDLTRVIATESAPILDGTPYGSFADDLRYLEPGFDARNEPEGAARQRASRYVLVFEYLSLAMASVIAHEIGHSLGLVKPGLPPDGLLAGVGGPWVVAPIDGGHIDTVGFNLMQSGSAFALGEALRSAPTFNAVNLAYLRRQLIVVDR